MSTNPSRAGLSRRTLVTAGAAALAAGGAGSAESAQLRGNIHHSVCLWCYGMSAAEMAPIAKKLDLAGIDLVGPQDFDALKQHGLLCTMTSGVWGGITRGLNRREHHEPIVASLRELIDATAAAGFPNVICFSGNRGGISDEEGLKVCADGVKHVAGYAEQKKVTLCMELLNSRVDHHDYQCDHTAWGVELCNRVGSDRFKLLYDIYHMQIMEGDVIRTIRTHRPFLGHFHTGGNPGRNEIDETQELNYPAVMRAIAETKFSGFVAQEFVPKKPDKIASLSQAIRICDV